VAEESSSGLTTAVQLALRAEAAQEVEDEHKPDYDLLGFATSETSKRGNLERAGKGRPPGARNHSTQFWQNYISRKYGSPLEVLGQMMRMPITDLARELNCSKFDAFTEKRRAAEALAPYMHPKLSSVAIFPPGDPRGGISTSLIVDSQDFDVVEDAAIVETAPAADAADQPRASTLSLTEQEPAAAPDTEKTDLSKPGDAPAISEATLAKALDTLLILARDPEIRRRMREMLE
jgi:hypothetical protein